MKFDWQFAACCIAVPALVAGVAMATSGSGQPSTGPVACVEEVDGRACQSVPVPPNDPKFCGYEDIGDGSCPSTKAVKTGLSTSTPSTATCTYYRLKKGEDGKCNVRASTQVYTWTATCNRASGTPCIAQD